MLPRSLLPSHRPAAAACRLKHRHHLPFPPCSVISAFGALGGPPAAFARGGGPRMLMSKCAMAPRAAPMPMMAAPMACAAAAPAPGGAIGFKAGEGEGGHEGQQEKGSCSRDAGEPLAVDLRRAGGCTAGGAQTCLLRHAAVHAAPPPCPVAPACCCCLPAQSSALLPVLQAVPRTCLTFGRTSTPDTCRCPPM